MEDLAVEHHAAADPRAKRYAGEALHTLSCSYEMFGPGRGACVLHDVHRHVEY
jgi:hypothetical protein